MYIYEQEIYERLNRDSPINKSATMLRIIENFCNRYKESLLGKNRYIDQMALNGGEEISVAFEKTLAENLKDIVPGNDLQNKDIIIAIYNSSGIESSVLIPEVGFYFQCNRICIIDIDI